MRGSIATGLLTAQLLALIPISIYSSIAAGPLNVSCGNYKVTSSEVILGVKFPKGTYRINSFGISCTKVMGGKGIFAQFLKLKDKDQLPKPWRYLADATGAPKFSSGAGIGFRVQLITPTPTGPTEKITLENPDKPVAKTTQPEIKPIEPPPVQVHKAGDECNPSLTSNIADNDGILYCVMFGDGKTRFLKSFTKAPVIDNPQSPESLDTCRPTDQRGYIPNGWDGGAITYPVKRSNLISQGTLNLAFVPIDFADVPGEGAPSDLFKDAQETMSRWYPFFSDKKLNIEYQVDDRWHRAPNPSTHYDVGEAKDVSNDGYNTKQLTEELISVVAGEYNFFKADAVIFIYPKNIKTIQRPVTRYMGGVKLSNGQSKSMMVMATSYVSYSDKYMGPLWLWIVHEMFHAMGLVMHFPVNPPGWGIEWGGLTPSSVLNPWNQSILNWLGKEQYYCADSSNLKTQTLTLNPIESEGPGLRTIFIRVSPSEVLSVVSHRKSTWSTNLPEDYYGTMVALFNTSKQNDRTGEFSPTDSGDDQTGNKYSKSGVYLHPFERTKSLGNPNECSCGMGSGEISDWGARMYVGDFILYKGVKIELVSAGNFDTVRISLA